MVNQEETLDIDLPLNTEAFLCYLKNSATIFCLFFCRGEIKDEGMDLIEDHKVFIQVCW